MKMIERDANRRDIVKIKLKWLCVLAFLNNVGYSCVWPLTTIYMHNELHKSLVLVGSVLLVYSLSNVVGSYLAGVLFNKLNTFWLNIFGQIITFVGIALLVVENGWPAYPLLLCIFGFGTGWILTMINALGTEVKDYSGTKVFNTLYLVENVGLVLGTAVTGFIYKYGISTLFFVIMCLYIISVYVTIKHFKQINVQRTSQKQNSDKKLTKIVIPKFNLLIVFSFLFGLIIIWVTYEQWMSNLAIYMQSFGVSTTQYSLLWTMNGLLIVAFQLGIGYLSKFFDTLKLQVSLGTLFLFISFIILYVANSYYLFITAMIVLTMGEALIVPAIPAYVNELSTPEKKGKYQGLVNSFSSLGRALGPLFGGVVIESLGYKPLFVVCIVANAILFVWYSVMVYASDQKIIKFESDYK